MANSDQLRSNKNQHKAKNLFSKEDDKLIYQAMALVQKYLEKRFPVELSQKDFFIQHQKFITLEEVIQKINASKIRNINTVEKWTKNQKGTLRAFQPDGGVLTLRSNNNALVHYLIFAEIKRQGTNDIRAKEGKQKQAEGNAIERLGKNLSIIRSLFKYETITPYIVFCWGYDFNESRTDVGAYLLNVSRLWSMNEFYDLNKINIFTKHPSSNNHACYQPISIYYQYEAWTIDQMLPKMQEVAETAVRTYIY